MTTENQPTPTLPTGEPKPSDRAFSQEDVDRIVKDRLKRIGDVDALSAKAKRADELEAELAQLREERELAGKSEAERAKAIAERTAARYERELQDERKRLADLSAERERIAGELRETRVGHQVSKALVEAKVYSAAMSDAQATFVRECEIETDERHGITAITFGGARFTSIGEAAAAFLKAKPYFASAPTTGGAGSRGGAPLGAGRSLADLPPEELAELIPLPNRHR